MKKKDKFIKGIVEMLEKMRKLTLEANVPLKKFESIAEDLESQSVKELCRRYDFLLELEPREYHGVLEIRRLLPDEVWQRYVDFDEYDLREQVLLREAQKKLRTAWKAFKMEKKDGPKKATESDASA